MSGAEGSGTLARFVARRDRRVLAACVVGPAAYFMIQTSALEAAFPTEAARAAYARTIGANATYDALYGPARAVETLGGLFTWRTLATGAAVVGLISVLLVGRHTRREEETGRAELVRAAAVGRWAPVTAALGVVAAADAAIGVLVALGLIALGLPAAGSLAYGAGLFMCGLVFAAVGAVTAQLTDNTRLAHGIGGGVVGAAFLLRAAGDAGAPALSWLSPIGWAQAMRPFSGERFWPLAIGAAALVVLVVAAYALLARRDLGGGLIAARAGPARASRVLLRHGLALRLQRGSLIGWSAGVGVAGLVLGAIGQNADDLVATAGSSGEVFTQAGGADVQDAYFGSMLSLLGLLAAGFTVAAVLRLRAEENAGHAEPLLAAPLGRARWAAGHLAVAVAGTALVLGAAGLGIGAAHAIGAGDAGQLPRLLAAALVQVPAAWVLGAVAALLYGAVPRAAVAAWGALGAILLLWLLGPLLDLPRWVTGISPYEHVPHLPAAAFSLGPLLALTAVAAALAGLGLTALRRRDVG
jgi:ABC-2 type transport system permease protein